MSILIPGSFGDIFAAIQIAYSIYDALRTSQGASHEYQALVHDMYNFHQLLEVLQATVKTTAIGMATRICLEDEIKSCCNLLNTIKKSIDKYGDTLAGTDEVTNRWTWFSGRRASKNVETLWRKFGWGVFKAPEIQTIRDNLARHQSIISLFLTSAGISQMDKIGQDVAFLKVTITGLVTAQNSMPPNVSSASINQVFLTNAFGIRMPILLECCISPETLHGFLRHYWSKKVGFKYIKDRRYTITTEDRRDENLLELDNGSNRWSTLVTTGAELVMSIQLVKYIDQATPGERICPRCGKTDVGIQRIGTQLQCMHCHRIISYFSLSKKSILQYLGLARAFKQEDTYDFRNISVVEVEKEGTNVDKSQSSSSGEDGPRSNRPAGIQKMADIPLRSNHSPVNQQKANIRTSLHPLLTPQTSIKYQLTLDPDTMQQLTPAHSKLSEMWACPASAPPVPFMRISCDQLPWLITVTPQLSNNYVTIGDVFHGLYRSLRTRISEQEWKSIRNEKERRVIAQAFETRCKDGPPDTSSNFLRQDGVKRVDFLGGRTRFMGIVPVNRGVNDYALIV